LRKGRAGAKRVTGRPVPTNEQSDQGHHVLVAVKGSTTSSEVALDTAPLPFLGAERHDLVENLLQAFDEVANSGTPQWWSLEAPPGWGKTRCVQELFARVAAEWQEQPAYWPQALVQPAAGGVQGGVDATRKGVAPDPAVANRDATPVSFWWGISCLSRPGSTFEALVNDLDQFRRHEAGWTGAGNSWSPPAHDCAGTCRSGEVSTRRPGWARRSTSRRRR
jgi:hypothetical protein